MYGFSNISPTDFPVTCTTGYRFGFNGKENDNEVKGTGNHQDYGMRMYDTRLGRFFSVDPLTKLYPWYSPFQFAGNKPIWKVDIDGLEEGELPRTVYHAKIDNVNADFVMTYFVMFSKAGLFNLVSRGKAKVEQQYSSHVVYSKMEVVVDQPGGIPYTIIHTVVEGPLESALETVGDVLTLYPGAPKTGPLTMLAKTPAKSQIVAEGKSALIYVAQEKKHKLRNFGTTMDLADDVAQQVLDKSLLVGKQRYGYSGGKVYEFKFDNASGWHGYPIPGNEAPADAIKFIKEEYKLTQSQYKKLIKGNE